MVRRKNCDIIDLDLRNRLKRSDHFNFTDEENNYLAGIWKFFVEEEFCGLV